MYNKIEEKLNAVEEEGKKGRRIQHENIRRNRKKEDKKGRKLKRLALCDKFDGGHP